MSDDRYREIARSLQTMGWLQDALLRQARKRVVEHLRKRGVVTALDAGCGAGTLSRYLSDAGMSVIAVDRSPAMLELAGRRASHAQCLQADLSRLSLSRPVDGAVVALSLHEMTESQRVEVWRALQRLTRHGGPLAQRRGHP
ncbi:putative type 11 methyltransferase [Thioalkalivibrio nitratireducens DSM 14787]|uniref:Type 11 methyltransferase n=1 Tax=Thioalkalivibrio nitratireducens (strain DSM 14787 / UNIQEM 213 / ALEN2) TaxID=1255043 RepID=L0E1Y3_THIND|nr:class I SAM-dependent methyltransferase [Thioalkalivibrio nitratireducens]AGA35303.1 putative type 11 methyltransferase [Thioalkalivibrio nitratireducens DSM 14787]